MLFPSHMNQTEFYMLIAAMQHYQIQREFLHHKILKFFLAFAPLSIIMPVTGCVPVSILTAQPIVLYAILANQQIFRYILALQRSSQILVQHRQYTCTPRVEDKFRHRVNSRRPLPRPVSVDVRGTVCEMEICVVLFPKFLTFATDNNLYYSLDSKFLRVNQALTRTSSPLVCCCGVVITPIN